MTSGRKLAVFAVEVERPERWRGWVVATDVESARECAIGHVAAGDENDESIHLEWMDSSGVIADVLDATQMCWYCHGDLDEPNLCSHPRAPARLDSPRIRELVSGRSDE